MYKKEIKIIDNFLDTDSLDILKHNIIFNKSFPFYLISDVSFPKNSSCGILHDDRVKNELWNWYGSHIVYENGPASSLYRIIDDILIEKINTIDPIRALIRIKVNFYPFTDNIKEHLPHIDYDFPHKSAIFSLNTCNGFTRITDEIKVDSIENRIIFFDSSETHNSSTTSDNKGRFNINLNWL
jgi:hypothetical protein